MQNAQKPVSLLLKRVKQRPILTVSDIDCFIQYVEIIEFYMLNNHVCLAMAPENIIDAGLNPRSQ